jgi:hypothetical protein
VIPGSKAWLDRTGAEGCGRAARWRVVPESAVFEDPADEVGLVGLDDPSSNATWMILRTSSGSALVERRRTTPVPGTILAGSALLRLTGRSGATPFALRCQGSRRLRSGRSPRHRPRSRNRRPIEGRQMPGLPGQVQVRRSPPYPAPVQHR